ncbi:MAG: hypothetical protein HYV17_06780 [Xanthomonadales bacterium]|nr:hypothetical protein [Xanthomonadales bacterium]
MRKIIFLDFDGVLHPDGVALFSRLDVFERHLARMPEAEVVVSSTWREDHSLDQLRAFFSPTFRPKIVGVTPSLAGGYDCGGRELEIRAYLSANNLTDANCAWVALDDMAMFFGEPCHNLILTESCEGFTERQGEQLLSWYASASGAG